MSVNVCKFSLNLSALDRTWSKKHTNVKAVNITATIADTIIYRKAVLWFPAERWEENR